ncbi:MAG: hypothetical protein SGJ01_19065 [Gemmatimonadota bacterium]|nr:hypothetical protein [Gemmatimonadota bacterium]
MRRTTTAFAVVIGLAGCRTLAAQSGAPDSAVVAVEDSTTDSISADTPAVARQPELEHPRHAKGAEDYGRRKNRRHHAGGEGGGVRVGGGETRLPRPSGGGETPRHATGGSDKPKPN